MENTLDCPVGILMRLKNPLMLRKGDYARAAELIESLQRELAELKEARNVR